MLLLVLLGCVNCALLARPVQCLGYLPEPIMQVELARGCELVVACTGIFRLKDARYSREYDSEIRCILAEDGIWADGRVWDSPLVMQPVGTGFCRVGDCAYRGTIEIRRDENLLVAVNVLPIEQYLYGISKYEISPSWLLSTLCAHAIASRTYALHKLWEGNGPISNTSHHQVYGGLKGEDPVIRIAIDSTRGQVLLYNGEVVNALYHACSGGYVTSCEDVWGTAYPYLIPHRDPFSDQSPYSYWQATLTRGELSTTFRKAGLISGEFTSLTIDSRDSSGRAKQISIVAGSDTSVVSGQRLREIIGYDVLKSTLFEFSTMGEQMVFQGRGWGHGVGMAQWGAARMGEAKHTTEEILEFYYPGANTVRMY